LDKECIFCKIVDKEIKAGIVYEDDEIIAFKDINPKAPVHILIIPKSHIPSINDINETDYLVLGKMFGVAKKVAVDNGISESGYRLVVNCKRNAGQEVFHIHMHLLGGRKMRWPPG